MAPFNKYIPTTEENYLGYSKGVDAPKPNMTLAKLFSGISDLTDEGIRGTDQLMEIKATEAAKQATKPLTEDVNNLSPEDAATLGRFKNKVSGLGSPTGTTGTEPAEDNSGLTLTGGSSPSEGGGGGGGGGEGDKPLPPVAQQELTNLDKWAQRYQNGQLSSTYLQLQQQKTVQQLSQRYPGYAEKIKQTVQGELHTANQIQNQIFQNFQAAAAASKAAQDKWITEVKGYEKELGADGVEKARGAINNPDMQWAIRAQVAGQRKSEHDQAQAKATLELKSAQRTANSNDFEQYATETATAKVADASSGILFGAKQMGLQTVQESINKLYASPGGEIDPILKQRTSAQLQEITTFTRNQIYNELFSQTRTDPTNPSKKTSVAAVIGVKKANDIIDEAMAPFLQSRKLLDGDNPSLAAGQLQLLNITKQNQALKTLSVPFFKLYGGLNETVGGQVAGQILELEYKKTDGTAMSDSLKALKQIQDGTTALQGGSGLNSNRQQMDQVDPNASPNDKATFLQGRIKFMQDAFRNPKATTEIKINAAKELSLEDTHAFIRAFRKSEQVDVWGQVAAPDVSKGVKEASNTDPKIWENYKNWNTNTFKVLFQEQVDHLRNKSASGSLTGIQYNPETNRIDYTRPPTVTGLGGRPVSRFPIGKDEIDKLDAGLRTINGVLSQDKDPTAIPKMLKEMNFPIATPDAAGKRSSVEGGNLSRLAYAPEGSNSENPLANIGGGEGFSSVSSSRVAAISKLPINSTVESVANKHDFDANALKAIIHIESSGKPTATTGKYKGLMQLSNEEFSRYGKKGGSIYNAADNIEAGVRSLKSKQAWFEDRVGRTPSITELYLMHQQGPGGLLAHERNPDAPAWENMYSTTEGQHRGPTWAKKAIWGNVPTDMKRQFGSVDNITSADFIKMWEAKLRGKTHG